MCLTRLQDSDLLRSLHAIILGCTIYCTFPKIQPQCHLMVTAAVLTSALLMQSLAFSCIPSMTTALHALADVHQPPARD